MAKAGRQRAGPCREGRECARLEAPEGSKRDIGSYYHVKEGTSGQDLEEKYRVRAVLVHLVEAL